jgi:hypothetical protein
MLLITVKLMRSPFRVRVRVRVLKGLHYVRAYIANASCLIPFSRVFSLIVWWPHTHEKDII